MARAYTIDAVVLTLQVPHKWLDNVLSHYAVSGVDQKRQGISRRLSIDAILIIGIARELIDGLGMSTMRALTLAEEMARNHGHHKLPRAELNVALNLPRFRALLLERLEAAVEAAPSPKRGRPPTNKTGRLD